MKNEKVIKEKLSSAIKYLCKESLILENAYYGNSKWGQDLIVIAILLGYKEDRRLSKNSRRGQITNRRSND